MRLLLIILGPQWVTQCYAARVIAFLSCVLLLTAVLFPPELLLCNIKLEIMFSSSVCLDSAFKLLESS